MTTQRAFQLRWKASRKDAINCQGYRVTVVYQSQSRSAHHISPMNYPGIELEPPRRQPPEYTLHTTTSLFYFIIYMYHIHVYHTFTAASEHHTTASTSTLKKCRKWLLKRNNFQKSHVLRFHLKPSMWQSKFTVEEHETKIMAWGPTQYKLKGFRS